MCGVAIGIHVHAEPEQLRATIDSVREHTALPVDIILLPDGADAETTAALADFSDWPQLASREARGAAACFNRLARNTETEILILLESGVRVGPNWLAPLLEALRTGPLCGLAGPTTNQSWNEQGVFPSATGDSEGIALAAQEAVQRFGSARRTLQPLYSLADFCYAVRREVFDTIGEADEAYGLGPCWEMDYNIRAARAGFQGLWVCASYVHRPPFTERRRREEALHFEASRHHYQDKFCGLRLQGRKTDYRSHCRGDACQNFAPAWMRWKGSPLVPLPALDAAVVGSVAENQPLVSCIMPTYNRRDFLPSALDCFLHQDYRRLELVIVDDGEDGVGDLIPKDSRIHYFHLPQKMTIGAKRNYACERAGGEIIMHWDDDDWYPADRVRRQVQAMIGSGADISGSSRLYYRQNDNRETFNRENFQQTNGGKAFLYQYDGGGRPWVAGNTLAYRRKFWRSHRFPDIQIAEDSYFIWSDARASVHDLKDPALCVASIHPANASPKYTSSAYWTPCRLEQLPSAFCKPVVASDDSAHFYPLISCLMPTFNRRSFIPLALQCFRAQTYPRKELVVMDDGSDPVGDLLEGAPDVRYLRLARRLTIGAKRNLACQEARGEIIAHWDDDDWYAPNRLELQSAPLRAGIADLTGLTNRFLLQMPRGQFWTTGDDLHRRMFVGDVHGGTLLFRKSILSQSVRYPESNLAEDAVLIQQAIRAEKRLLRMENPGTFVYLRHQRNAWQFEAGRFMDPAGWRTTTAPPGFSAETLDLYREAAGVAT